ncbi:MAG: formimidoylglutamase [Bacteroidales bacterium]|nr:formimidoylglutamase [Bacteroidales bacterium]MDD3663680.1 formimidoylglutamase [Bacteroidales bacterium]
MNDISLYFKPLTPEVFDPESYSHLRVGHQIKAYTTQGQFPDLSEADLVLIGIAENRGRDAQPTQNNGPDEIRKYFYKLFPARKQMKIADLGNMQTGSSLEDTWAALSEIVGALLESSIIPIILGGGQHLSWANYKAYENMGQIINIASVDPRFDLGGEEADAPSQSWLSRIILHQPNYLFNYTNIGYQTYFVDQDAIKLMKNMFFDIYRLGFVNQNIEEIEPMVRNADMLSVDVSAVRRSDAPGCINASPNGFYGEQLCQMMRFAGMSDKLTSVGIYEYDPEKDQEGQTAHLLGQMLWYFVEGFYNRMNDFPVKTKDQDHYMKFHVAIEGQKDEVVFYKSVRSNRWWMEVTCPAYLQTKFARHYLVACSYADYQAACNNDLPDRWWQVYQKLM